LFENELFGHESGAFTDARTPYSGVIRMAEGGTVFLDDVESLSLINQAKLLRFLQGNEYIPLGHGRPIRAHVRIIAATNADLSDQVKKKAFREDLYFRLEVLKVVTPPLRERTEDIIALTRHFVSRYSLLYGKQAPALTESATRVLCRCPNILHRAVVHCSTGTLTEDDIDIATCTQSDCMCSDPTLLPYDQARKKMLATFESEYVSRLLQLCGGNITHAARRAGKPRRTFWEIMRRNRLSPSKD
jgi:two-component system, NtrC family, response regulator GlrR